MELSPIGATIEENKSFADHPDCQTSLPMTIEFFNRIGYTPPWIGYFARINDKIVGGAAFKGGPKDGKVEIAYSTFPAYQRQGIGSEMCRLLVVIALHNNPAIKITARTLEQENYSTRILKKNGFKCVGTVWDEEDGTVLEWEYRSTILSNSIKSW
ncbi:MAG: GNAT family protein [Dyadobacter sp.]|uniref:GNAT family N-acetyltransferase n=1 Tax=Dyadobacter sp. TaxID=1914288 RepID=UPI003267DE5F